LAYSAVVAYGYEGWTAGMPVLRPPLPSAKEDYGGWKGEENPPKLKAKAGNGFGE